MKKSKMPPRKMAKGGKIKGYANGSYIDGQWVEGDTSGISAADYAAIQTKMPTLNQMTTASTPASAPISSSTIAGAVGAGASLASAGTNLITSGSSTNPGNVKQKDIATDVVSDAGKGATTGAEIGSLAGPEGTAIGAGVGAVAGGLEGWYRGANQGNKDKAALNQQIYNSKPHIYQNPGSAYKKGGLLKKLSQGGLTSTKAKEILTDGTAQGKVLTAKQKRFFGAIAGGQKEKLAGGGGVGGAGGGGGGMGAGPAGGIPELGPPEGSKKRKGRLFAQGGDIDPQEGGPEKTVSHKEGAYTITQLQLPANYSRNNSGTQSKKEVQAGADIMNAKAILDPLLIKKGGLKPGDPGNIALSTQEIKDALGANYDQWRKSIKYLQNIYQTGPQGAGNESFKNIRGTNEPTDKVTDNDVTYGAKMSGLIAPHMKAVVPSAPQATTKPKPADTGSAPEPQSNVPANDTLPQSPAAPDKPAPVASPKPKPTGNVMMGQGWAEGGQIKGKGGPKDDKIPMKAEEGSFVVPAENASKAMALRNKYLAKGGTLTAGETVGDGDDVPVKVSNGEHIFTPEEVSILKSRGVNLNALAPHADTKLSKADGGDIQDVGLKKGGIHIKKANIGSFNKIKKETGKSTEELTHSSNPATRKKAVFALSASKWNHKDEGGLIGQLNAMMKGGKVQKKADGGNIVDSSQKKVIDSPEEADVEQKVNSKIVIPTSNHPTPNKKFINTQSNIGNAIRNFDVSGTDRLKKGGKVKGYATGGTTDPLEDPTNQGLAGSDVQFSGDQTNNDGSALDTGKKPITLQAREDFSEGKPPVDKSTGKPDPAPTNNTAKYLGVAQAGLGLAQTLAYKRPTYTIPAEVQAAYSQASQNATYGLDPAAKAAIEREIAARTNTSRGLIASVSGGNAATALNAIQHLNSNAGTSLIKMYAEDAAAKRAKQGQVYGLAGQLGNYRNFAYGQDMNAFMQNQRAGSDLLNAGISNVAGSYNYDKALEAQRQRDALYGPSTPYKVQ
jgi:hypothetical protein